MLRPAYLLAPLWSGLLLPSFRRLSRLNPASDMTRWLIVIYHHRFLPGWTDSLMGCNGVQALACVALASGLCRSPRPLAASRSSVSTRSLVSCAAHRLPVLALPKESLDSNGPTCAIGAIPIDSETTPETVSCTQASGRISTLPQWILRRQPKRRGRLVRPRAPQAALALPSHSIRRRTHLECGGRSRQIPRKREATPLWL